MAPKYVQYVETLGGYGMRCGKKPSEEGSCNVDQQGAGSVSWIEKAAGQRILNVRGDAEMPKQRRGAGNRFSKTGKRRGEGSQKDETVPKR